jgi:hypothetical protein
MKNTVTLVRFVGNNPETRETQSGAKITTVSLATTRGFKDAEGIRQTAKPNGTGSFALTASGSASPRTSPRAR